MPQFKEKPHAGRRSIATLLAFSIPLLSQLSVAQEKVFILTLDGFERSAFLKSHKPTRKSNWALKSGGTNYSYAFPDPDGTDESVSVELSSAPFLLTTLGVSFNGTSLRAPAKFGERRERFLRDLLSSTHPDVPIEKVIAFVKSEQGRTYTGGSDQMPRVPIGNANVYVGTVGVGLIVGLSR